MQIVVQLYKSHSMPLDYKGNGCGPDGWKGRLIPDKLGGIDISEACKIHDYDYEVGGSELDRQESNLNFLRNMVVIIMRDDTWNTNQDVALKWATIYYTNVQESGSDYFNYKSV